MSELDVFSGATAAQGMRNKVVKAREFLARLAYLLRRLSFESHGLSANVAQAFLLRE